MYHCGKFHQNRSIHFGDIAFFKFFKDGGHQPYWICLGVYLEFGPPMKDTWWFLLTMHNLVGIDALLLII